MCVRMAECVTNEDERCPVQEVHEFEIWLKLRKYCHAEVRMPLREEDDNRMDWQIDANPFFVNTEVAGIIILEFTRNATDPERAIRLADFTVKCNYNGK